MKIDKIILSCDDNPKYDGLWEIVSEICYKRLNIEPVLFHITNEDSDFFKDKYGLIKKVKKIPNLSSGFQSQIYRMFGTKFFKDEMCLTSDIDMLMLDKSYFLSPLEFINEDDMVIYCSDAYNSNRSECIGIYSENRYPICYVLGKGHTFNKIINTDCDFKEYVIQLLLKGYPLHDTDELYFGDCVNNKNHGVIVHKLKRGYKSPFICNNRVDRINDDIFNNYDKEKLINNEYIDIHLSRPYKKWKREIDEIKNIILNDIKDVYLIGCHVENETQLNLLNRTIDKIIKSNKKFVLSSHTLLPQEIIDKSVGFIYDSCNPKYKSWELENKNKFFFETDQFLLISPYISYGASDYYHIGALRLIINGLKYIQNLDYDIVHWIEYDTLPKVEMESQANKLLNEYDFIFYGIGSRFSVNVKNLNNDFLKFKNENIFQCLKQNDYVAEKVISNYLTQGKKHIINVDEFDIELCGEYSQHIKEVRLNWSLFKHNNTINLFLTSRHNQVLSITYIINHQNSNTINLSPNQWRYIPIGNELNHFKLLCNDKIIIDIDLKIDDNYKKLIDSVEFYPK